MDYTKLAALAGLKNEKTASSFFSAVKKKLLAGATPQGAAPGSASKKKAGKAVADKTTDADDDNNNNNDEATGGVVADNQQTPTSKPKKTAGRKPKAAVADVPPTPSADDAGEITSSGFTPINAGATDAPTTPNSAKKRARKPKDPNAPPAKRVRKTPAKAKSEPAEAGDDEAAAVDAVPQESYEAGYEGEETYAYEEGVADNELLGDDEGDV